MVETNTVLQSNYVSIENKFLKIFWREGNIASMYMNFWKSTQFTKHLLCILDMKPATNKPKQSG